MEFKITGCIDCPMLDSGAHHEYQCFCIHPKAPRQFSDFKMSQEEQDAVQQIEVDEDWDRNPFHIPITPDWCPLNKESITIIKESTQQ